MKPRRDPLLFRGMMTALITPFRDDKVDFDALADLVDWQVGQGVQGLVACGTTAESPTLSHSEWTDVIGVCVQAAGGRVPVIAGSGVNDTRRTIELTNEAAHLGADAALVVTPSYSRPNQEGLFRHFESTRTHQCTDAHGKFTTRGATCTRFLCLCIILSSRTGLCGPYHSIGAMHQRSTNNQDHSSWLVPFNRRTLTNASTISWLGATAGVAGRSGTSAIASAEPSPARTPRSVSLVKRATLCAVRRPSNPRYGHNLWPAGKRAGLSTPTSTWVKPATAGRLEADRLPVPAR